jgi:hypothetical protein
MTATAARIGSALLDMFKDKSTQPLTIQQQFQFGLDDDDDEISLKVSPPPVSVT